MQVRFGSYLTRDLFIDCLLCVVLEIEHKGMVVRTKAEITSLLPQPNHLGYFTFPTGLLHVWEEVDEKACSHFGPHFKPEKLLRSPVNGIRLDKEMQSGEKGA